MFTTHHKVLIGKTELSFHLDQDTPIVTVKGNKYTTLHQLVKDVPELSNPENIEAFAEISNFMFKGIEFTFIDNIPEFQKEYVKRLEQDKKHPEKPSHGLHFSDYGIYRIEIMHPPKIERGHLIYFVKNGYTQLPYRVSCPFPFTGDHTVAKYELLPNAHV